MPEMVLSPSFHEVQAGEGLCLTSYGRLCKPRSAVRRRSTLDSITEVCFGMPCRTVPNLNTSFSGTYGAFPIRTL
ncbi:hypothetical protein IQ238_18065 [Pleurocapsales cyanobacterium LEGE 06147]|nr:hypothetical protein [Pleurocapsales cyanobacterium LEGE 06147]